MNMQVCHKCKKLLSMDNFHKHGKGLKTFRRYCKECRRKQNREYSKSTKVKEMKRRNQNKTKLKLKTEIINHCGGKCVCCGETEIRFLTIDHINNDGYKDRKFTNGKGGQAFYRYIRKLNWPKEKLITLRVLCANCHLAIFGGQICPHSLLQPKEV